MQLSPRQPHKGANVILFIIFKLILTRRVFLSSLTCGIHQQRFTEHILPQWLSCCHKFCFYFGFWSLCSCGTEWKAKTAFLTETSLVKGLMIVTEWWQKMSLQFCKTAECWVYYTAAENFIVQGNSICKWVQVWMFFDQSTAEKWHPPPANGTPRIVIFQALCQSARTDLELFPRERVFVTALGLFLRKALSCRMRYVFQFRVSGTRL